MSTTTTAQCSCGKTQFTIRGKAIMRGYCHCTICQEFNNGPYADITVFLGKDVDLPDPSLVNYKSYAKPELVLRGKCVSCEQPAVEYAKMGPLGRAIIVPTENIKDAAWIPEAAMHAFYHRRVADIDDGLPKHSGYLKSQLAFTGKMLAGLVKGKK